jgi:hypothetical protein
MYTPEQIQKRFESLPEDVKEAISSIDTTNTILEIGRSNSIQIDELGELVDETGLVMLGFTKPSDFVSNIESRLGVSKEIAEKLVKEINEKILLKIRESLKKITEEKKEIEEKIDVEEIIRPKKLLEEQKSDLDEEDMFDHQKEREDMMRELEGESFKAQNTETQKLPNKTQNTKIENGVNFVEQNSPSLQGEAEAIHEENKFQIPNTKFQTRDTTNDVYGQANSNTEIQNLKQEKETDLIKKPTNTSVVAGKPEMEITEPAEMDIIESKMKGIIKMPIEKKETVENMPQTEQQKIQNNTTDPYREPIE